MDGVKIDGGGDFSFSWIGQLFRHTEPSHFAELRALFLFGQQNKGEKKRLGSFSLWCFRYVASNFLWEMSTRSYFFYLTSPLTAFEPLLYVFWIIFDCP